ncbi:MAG: V-type ATP synthase subunit E [Candidatus Krumholzibacteria bacterium]|nr:V-type ATP synthase subunit E [Candidatus Krumholzibacteria bacterium]
MVDNESVDKICGQIREDGEREIESILDKARRTAGEITAKAEAQRGEIAGRIMREAEARGKTESRRMLSSVSIEVRRARLRAREEVVSVVSGMVEKELAAMRGSKRYPDVLAGLVTEAVRGLEGKSFVVTVDKRDLDLLEKEIFPRVKQAMTAEGRPVNSLQARPLDKASLGGARVGVPGGNVIFDNTFEARMFRFREEIRAGVIDRVFYSDHSGESGSA